MRRLFCLLFLLLIAIKTQELRATVRVDARRINQDNTLFFKDLEQKIATLLNTTHWSADAFRPEERIDCAWVFTITNSDLDGGLFSGYLQLSVQRPIFRTTYISPILLINDEHMYFNYWNDDFLEYQEGFKNTNLVSLLAFYAYIVLGFDYDSFAEWGGEWAFQKAQEIFWTSQYLGVRGWDQKGFRYSYIDQFNIAAYREFRKNLYLYHRLGLDLLTENRERARVAVLQALQNIQKVTQDFSYLALIYNFVQNKEQEIIQFFEGAPRVQKDAVYKAMQSLDFKRIQRYDVLLK